MKKLDYLFKKSHKQSVERISNASMNTMSEIARAAMTIGLKELEGVYVEDGRVELYAVVKQNQGDE